VVLIVDQTKYREILIVDQTKYREILIVDQTKYRVVLIAKLYCSGIEQFSSNIPLHDISIYLNYIGIEYK